MSLRTTIFSGVKRLFRRIAMSLGKQRDIWFSLSFSTLDLFAGAISAFILLFTIEKTPWIICILPILLSVRGAGNGIFTGVLSTSLHIGTVEPRLRGNTEDYYSLVAAIYVISTINSFIATVIVGIYFLDYRILLIIFFVMILSMTLTLIFSIITTSLVGFSAFRYGFNPDDIVYPVMATLNDIMISIFIFISILIIEPWDFIHAMLIGIPISLSIIALTISIIRKHRHNEFFVKTIREGSIGIIYVVIISSTSGILLSQTYWALHENIEFLIMLPLLMTLSGGVGSILMSRFTTRLNLGEIDPSSPLSIITFLGRTLQLVLPPLLGILTIGSIIICITRSMDMIGFFLFYTKIIAISFSTLFISVPIILLVSLETFKYGLNPDNYSIPIVTSTADFLTIFFLHIIL